MPYSIRKPYISLSKIPDLLSTLGYSQNSIRTAMQILRSKDTSVNTSDSISFLQFARTISPILLGQLNQTSIVENEPISCEEIDDVASAIVMIRGHHSPFVVIQLFYDIAQLISHAINQPKLPETIVISDEPLFHNRITRHTGGKQLLRVAGFALQCEPPLNLKSKKANSNLDTKTLSLKLIVPKESIHRPDAVLDHIRTSRDKLEEEIERIEQCPALSRVLRTLTTTIGAEEWLLQAINTALVYIRNVLQMPQVIKFSRIRTSNSAFVERIGKHHGGLDLMYTLGFVSQLGNELLVLRGRTFSVMESMGYSTSLLGQNEQWKHEKPLYCSLQQFLSHRLEVLEAFIQRLEEISSKESSFGMHNKTKDWQVYGFKPDWVADCNTNKKKVQVDVATIPQNVQRNQRNRLGESVKHKVDVSNDHFVKPNDNFSRLHQRSTLADTAKKTKRTRIQSSLRGKKKQEAWRSGSALRLGLDCVQEELVIAAFAQMDQKQEGYICDQDALLAIDMLDVTKDTISSESKSPEQDSWLDFDSFLSKYHREIISTFRKSVDIDFVKSCTWKLSRALGLLRFTCAKQECCFVFQTLMDVVQSLLKPIHKERTWQYHIPEIFFMRYSVHSRGGLEFMNELGVVEAQESSLTKQKKLVLVSQSENAIHQIKIAARIGRLVLTLQSQKVSDSISSEKMDQNVANQDMPLSQAIPWAVQRLAERDGVEKWDVALDQLILVQKQCSTAYKDRSTVHLSFKSKSASMIVQIPEALDHLVALGFREQLQGSLSWSRANPTSVDVTTLELSTLELQAAKHIIRHSGNMANSSVVPPLLTQPPSHSIIRPSMDQLASSLPTYAQPKNSHSRNLSTNAVYSSAALVANTAPAQVNSFTQTRHMQAANAVSVLQTRNKKQQGRISELEKEVEILQKSIRQPNPSLRERTQQTNRISESKKLFSTISSNETKPLSQLTSLSRQTQFATNLTGATQKHFNVQKQTSSAEFSSRLVHQVFSGAYTIEIEDKGLRVPKGSQIMIPGSQIVHFEKAFVMSCIDGILQLNEKLRNTYNSGHPVFISRPNRSSKKDFEQWSVNRFIQDSLLDELLDIVVEKAEKIKRARAEQWNFQNRPCTTSVFSCNPTLVKRITFSQSKISHAHKPKMCVASLEGKLYVMGRPTHSTNLVDFGIIVFEDTFESVELLGVLNGLDETASGVVTPIRVLEWVEDNNFMTRSPTMATLRELCTIEPDKSMQTMAYTELLQSCSMETNIAFHVGPTIMPIANELAMSQLFQVGSSPLSHFTVAIYETFMNALEGDIVQLAQPLQVRSMDWLAILDSREKEFYQLIDLLDTCLPNAIDSPKSVDVSIRATLLRSFNALKTILQDNSQSLVAWNDILPLLQNPFKLPRIELFASRKPPLIPKFNERDLFDGLPRDPDSHLFIPFCIAMEYNLHTNYLYVLWSNGGLDIRDPLDDSLVRQVDLSLITRSCIDTNNSPSLGRRNEVKRWIQCDEQSLFIIFNDSFAGNGLVVFDPWTASLCGNVSPQIRSIKHILQEIDDIQCLYDFCFLYKVSIKLNTTILLFLLVLLVSFLTLLLILFNTRDVNYSRQKK